MLFIIAFIVGFCSMHIWTHYTVTGRKFQKWYFEQFDRIEAAIKKKG